MFFLKNAQIKTHLYILHAQQNHPPEGVEE